MMREALFEVSGVPCSLPLDKVLHILTTPEVFSLPMLRPAFTGAFVYHEQVVPLLSGKRQGQASGEREKSFFVLVCEAEYGLVGVPADRIIQITKAGEQEPGWIPQGNSSADDNKVNGRDYRQLDLNEVVEDYGFSVSGL